MDPVTPRKKLVATATDGSDFKNLESALCDSESRNLLEDMKNESFKLNAHLGELSEVHNNIVTFNNSFSSLLYGLKMNSWCVEFPEAPKTSSFKEDRSVPRPQPRSHSPHLSSVEISSVLSSLPRPSPGQPAPRIPVRSPSTQRGRSLIGKFKPKQHKHPTGRQVHSSKETTNSRIPMSVSRRLH